MTFLSLHRCFLRFTVTAFDVWSLLKACFLRLLNSSYHDISQKSWLFSPSCCDNLSFHDLHSFPFFTQSCFKVASKITHSNNWQIFPLYVAFIATRLLVTQPPPWYRSSIITSEDVRGSYSCHQWKHAHQWMSSTERSPPHVLLSRLVSIQQPYTVHKIYFYLYTTKKRPFLNCSLTFLAAPILLKQAPVFLP